MSKRTRRSGQLEAEVMSILWAAPEALSVRGVCEAFDDSPPAYTTVATVLGRLLEKGQVRRTGAAQEGYRFAPSQSDGEYTSARMISALRETSDRKAALLNFAGNLDEVDIQFLREAFGE